MLKEWIPIILSGLSLFVSLIVSWNSWWQSRALLKIEKLQESIFLKSFDGCIKSYSFECKDDSPNFHSVILIDLIITNKSSKPISILEFSIPNFSKFNSYSMTQDAFYVTCRGKPTMHIGGNKPIKYLKPEFTIDPYTSIRGDIFFWSSLEVELDISKHIPLTIKTSRKPFKKNIQIDSEYDSIKKRVRISKNEEGNIVKKFY